MKVNPERARKYAAKMPPPARPAKFYRATLADMMVEDDRRYAFEHNLPLPPATGFTAWLEEVRQWVKAHPGGTYDLYTEKQWPGDRHTGYLVTWTDDDAEA